MTALRSSLPPGGGGAFLHGTHWLEDTVDLEGKSDNDKWLNRKVTKLSLKRSPAASHGEVAEEACYPTRDESRSMVLGDFKFVVLNPVSASSGSRLLAGWTGHGSRVAGCVVIVSIVMALDFGRIQSARRATPPR